MRKTISECTPEEFHKACLRTFDKDTTVFVPDGPLAIRPGEWSKGAWFNVATRVANSIEHPPHYTEGRKYEPWDVIEDWGLNYFAATALKYISRYERKGDPIRDLKKAIEFLKREVERLERKV